MSYITNKETYTINSANRTSGTHSDFTYVLDKSTNNYDHVVVLSARIKKSFYLVGDGYNTFTLRENKVDATVTIPVGNYRYNTFLTAVQTALNSASPNTWTYAVTYSSLVNKFTFTTSSGGGDIAFIFATNLQEQMGFEKNSTNAFVADSLTSVNQINMQAEDTLFINSDCVSNATGTNTLQHVFASGNDLTVLKFDCDDILAYSRRLKTNASNTYHFTVVDENNRTIGLCGVNWVAVIMLFKLDPIYDNIRNYMKFALKQ